MLSKFLWSEVVLKPNILRTSFYLALSFSASHFQFIEISIPISILHSPTIAEIMYCHVHRQKSQSDIIFGALFVSFSPMYICLFICVLMLVNFNCSIICIPICAFLSMRSSHFSSIICESLEAEISTHGSQFAALYLWLFFMDILFTAICYSIYVQHSLFPVACFEYFFIAIYPSASLPFGLARSTCFPSV